MTDCSGFIQPLDLECLLVNTFAGNLEIFTFIAIIAITGLAAYFRMPNSITLIMIALFAIILFPVTSFLYSITIFFGAIITFYTITKIFKA